jgi:hypothetical protein
MLSKVRARDGWQISHFTLFENRILLSARHLESCRPKERLPMPRLLPLLDALGKLRSVFFEHVLSLSRHSSKCLPRSV